MCSSRPGSSTAAAGVTWRKTRRSSGPCRIRICNRVATSRRRSTVLARVLEMRLDRSPRRAPRTAGKSSDVEALRRVVVVGSAFLLVGCYTLQPTGGQAPQPGVVIGLDINDAGRAALGGSMGPEIDQVEGRLVERNNNEYVVAVNAVR